LAGAMSGLDIIGVIIIMKKGRRRKIEEGNLKGGKRKIEE
jgi:hypothetical protein